MKITLKIEGLDELRAGLKDFSERRMKAAVATALTRTAKTVSGEWQGQLNTRLDRPNPLTQRATSFTGATAQSLSAEVFVKDKAPGKGTAPDRYLKPQVTGGGRLLKKFEDALVAAGGMPSGYVTVPGRHATRDAYGNVSRGQIIAVLSQLGSDFSPGYQRVISKSVAKRLASQAKRGRKYIVVRPEEARKANASAGIYERMPDGSRHAIFLFKPSVSYRQRLSLVDDGAKAKVVGVMLNEIDRAIEESLQRLRERGLA
jgi:hypothetical protein